MPFRRHDPRHFFRKVKSTAYRRCNGLCQSCNAALRPGYFEYHHTIPWAISHDSTLHNCTVLCLPCHGLVTDAVDIPTIAKSNRQRDRHIGAMDKSRNPFPCGRDSAKSKTVRGRVVVRLSGAQKHALAMAARKIG